MSRYGGNPHSRKARARREKMFRDEAHHARVMDQSDPIATNRVVRSTGQAIHKGADVYELLRMNSITVRGPGAKTRKGQRVRSKIPTDAAGRLKDNVGLTTQRGQANDYLRGMLDPRPGDI